MKESLLSLAAGAVCGGVFAFAKLPVPAPTVLPGILGIVGVFGGYKLALMLLSR